MKSYIAQNKKALGERHYIANARSSNSWFNFARGKLQGYVKSYGDCFCMVVSRSDSIDDAYILPYREVKALFSESTLASNGNRWIGWIIEDVVLRIASRENELNVSRYHNAVEQLTAVISSSYDAPPESECLQVPTDFEKPPLRFSAWVTRPIRDTPRARSQKSTYDFRCQICGTRIESTQGLFYAEVHHIQPLGGGHRGLDTKNNMLVLCPNHHAMFDFGIPRFLSATSVRIVDTTYKLTSSHTISRDAIDYHNNKLHNRRDKGECGSIS